MNVLRIKIFVLASLLFFLVLSKSIFGEYTNNNGVTEFSSSLIEKTILDDKNISEEKYNLRG